MIACLVPAPTTGPARVRPSTRVAAPRLLHDRAELSRNPNLSLSPV
jgi:hypothetical protein